MRNAICTILLTRPWQKHCYLKYILYHAVIAEWATFKWPNGMNMLSSVINRLAWVWKTGSRIPCKKVSHSTTSATSTHILPCWSAIFFKPTWADRMTRAICEWQCISNGGAVNWNRWQQVVWAICSLFTINTGEQVTPHRHTTQKKEKKKRWWKKWKAHTMLPLKCRYIFTCHTSIIQKGRVGPVSLSLSLCVGLLARLSITNQFCYWRWLCQLCWLRRIDIPCGIRTTHNGSRICPGAWVGAFNRGGGV